MRTTVTLDEDVAAQLTELTHRLRKPFKVVLNEVIRRGLGASGKAVRSKPFQVEPHDCRLRPGFDPAGFNQLADELEAEAFLEKLSRSR